ncbi:adenylyl-sulfate kinase [Membranihabitans marinus]|uniref:adenylyl-sulfate kinase n=1 Tax=Membranihabitans marinus TaxID=1227546 RepID=UPI001F003C54|nr:adenylyl-sulfate kinase [Membranihabitans marinus]
MEHIYPIYNNSVPREEKENFLGQRGTVFWLTGLSGSGKSTLALKLEKSLLKLNHLSTILDGDNVRSGLCKDLTFIEADREENVRRISELAKLFVRNGIVTICSFVSPLQSMRQLAKETIGASDFHLIHVKASVETCIQRDTKGLYKMALGGELKNFTGIDAPFDLPENPDLVLDTEEESEESNIQILLNYVLKYIKL